MENRPLISVITVCYNAAPVIQKTLNSLEAQSFQDFEYVIVDGNSRDNTLEVVKKSPFYSNKKERDGLITIMSEPDKGIYDAMNKGLSIAKGKYVIFLNAGDAFHDIDSLECYAKQALLGQDIIYGDTVIVDSQDRWLADRHLSAPKVLTKDSFADGMLVCHQAFMVKKNLAPFYDLSYRFSADYDWCVKCIEASDPTRCCNLNRVTIKYLNDGLTDKNKWKSLRERFSIMSRHYGLSKTILNHFRFIVRAVRRGKV